MSQSKLLHSLLSHYNNQKQDLGVKIWCCVLHGLAVGWKSAWWLAAHLKCCIWRFLDPRLGWMDLRLGDDGLIGRRICEYNGWVLTLWWWCGACGFCMECSANIVCCCLRWNSLPNDSYIFLWHSSTFLWSSRTSIFQRNFFTIL